MTSAENFCLKWNDFRDNIANSFTELRESKEFSDITLACEGEQKIEAHKVVLASASPVFREILKTTKKYNTMVYMRGMKAEDLKIIVDFIYQGEVNILQENLENFLALADELQLRGLCGQGQTDDISPRPDAQDEYNIGAINVSPKQDFVPNEHKKPYLKSETYTQQAVVPFEKFPVQVNVSNFSDLDGQILTMMGKVNGAWSCTLCGKTDKKNDKRNIMTHVEANHIDGITLPCNKCGKIFRSRHNLSMHIFRSHK